MTAVRVFPMQERPMAATDAGQASCEPVARMARSYKRRLTGSRRARNQ
jgi:hypothetical protein